MTRLRGPCNAMQRGQPQRHAAAWHVLGEEQAAHVAASQHAAGTCHPCTMPASCHATCSAAASPVAGTRQLLRFKPPAVLLVLVLVLVLAQACCMAAARPMRVDPYSGHHESSITDNIGTDIHNVGGGWQGHAQVAGDAYSSRGDDVYRLEAAPRDDEERARLYAELAQLYFVDTPHTSGDEGEDNSGDGGGISGGLGVDSADGRGRLQQQRQLQHKRTPNPPVNITGTFRGEVWEQGQEHQPSGYCV